MWRVVANERARTNKARPPPPRQTKTPRSAPKRFVTLIVLDTSRSFKKIVADCLDRPDTHVAEDPDVRPDLVARALLGTAVVPALPVVVEHFHLPSQPRPK